MGADHAGWAVGLGLFIPGHVKHVTGQFFRTTAPKPFMLQRLTTSAHGVPFISVSTHGVGAAVGASVAFVGAAVGTSVGAAVGATDGTFVGFSVGLALGLVVGTRVGLAEGLLLSIPGHW